MNLRRLANLFAMAFSFNEPSFSATHGNNPRSINGGNRSGAAAQKRAAKKSRNISKNPRGAA